MTKEELKLILYESYTKYNKLEAIKALNNILKTGLERSKTLIDFIGFDNYKPFAPILFILHYNLIWKKLTKEELKNIRYYDNWNSRQDRLR